MFLLTETASSRYIEVMEKTVKGGDAPRSREAGGGSREAGGGNRESYSREQAVAEISRVLAETEDSQLIQGFLESLLTPSELDETASRWELVRRINRGISQRTIARDLGLSLCKITRGSKVLKEENSAFKRMIEKAEDLDQTSR